MDVTLPLIECYVTVRLLGGVLGGAAIILSWAVTMCVLWIVRDQQEKQSESRRAMQSAAEER